MSDVFREVDEDLRRDQLKRIWQRFGKFIIAGAVLVVVAVAAAVILNSMREGRAAADGDRFYAAVALEEAGDFEAARAAFNALREDGTGGYPTLAAFHLAGIEAKTGNAPAAVAAFDAIAADATLDQSLRDVAAIRAAMVLLDSATFDEIAARLSPFNVDGNPYRFVAMELMAVAAINEGRYQEATELIGNAMSFQDVMLPQQTQRFGELFSFMISRDDYQFVPPGTPAGQPAPPAAPTFDPAANAGEATPEPAPATPDLRAPTPPPAEPAAPGALIPGLGAELTTPPLPAP